MARLGRILVVDDEAIARKDLAATLSDRGYEVETAADAFKALGKLETFAPHVVVTDLKMPGMTGLELTHKLRALDLPPAVIVLTGHGEVQTAIEAIRTGVVEYLSKPVDLDKLILALEKTIDRQKLVTENRVLRERVRDRYAPSNIVGESAPMRRVFDLIEQIAPSASTVLISGESGTGKELAASAIHERSGRSGPLVRLHCASLSEQLLESELFGHERGAFPGATARKDGRLQLADGGTLLLDGIADISPAVQAKLLRFLQDNAFERTGGTQTLQADVRMIVVTTRNLEEEVATKRFREDLYYRLNVLAFEMPPLRHRVSDIPLLAKLFLDRHASAHRKLFDGFSPEALDCLCAHDWPGNVRELENAIERGAVFAAGPLFEARHLPPALTRSDGGRRIPRIPGSTLAELTRYAILETLEATGGSTARAAEILGISARTIQYKLHEYSDSPQQQDDVVRKSS
jgi:DNA-binding NtrC family response regulator